MPMYEKGSVRAEPRSKQQERMKKIMKKFLSSLLALTMILSLVIVPARAATTEGATGSFTISGPTTASEGDSVSFSITNPKITYNGTDYAATVSNYQWTGLGDSVTANTETYSGTVGNQNLSINCTVTLNATVGSGESPTQVTVENSTLTTAKSVTVTTKQAAFEAATKKVTYNGRKYDVTNKAAIVYYFADSFDTAKLGIEVTGSAYSGATLTNKSNDTYTVKASSAANAPSMDITITFTKVTPTVTISDNLGSGVSPIVGHDYTLTATYTNSNRDTSADIQYSWKIDGQTTTSTRNTITWTPGTPGSHKVSCSVKEGSEVAANSGETTYTVVAEQYKAVSNNGGTRISLVPGRDNTVTIAMPSIQNKSDSSESYSNSFSAPNTVNWVSLKVKSGEPTNVVSINETTKVVTGLKTGSTVIVATVSFRGAEYKVEYTVNVKALDATLSDLTNGDDVDYSQSELKRTLAGAIDDVYDNFSSSDIKKIQYVESSSSLTVKDGSTLRLNSEITGGVNIAADKGYLGTANIVLKVTDNSNKTYNVTLYVTVAGDEKIDATVTGSSSNSSVTFDVNDAVDYTTLYLYGSSKSNLSTSKPSDSDYTGSWTKTTTTASGWVKYSSSDSVTVPASKFSGSSGKVTLYVVGVDSSGIASTGTITVSQKSYDINYNVVAGKSVSFSQKDFEDFLEDIADDNGDYNSRKDELSFDHAVLTSSIPSTRSEGTLYYGSTEITSSNKSKTDMTDMDKVSFDSVSKPTKDTVTLTFKVYGDLYKNGSSRKTEVKYDVNVVISVVKEDITYTVGIDDTVQLTARDFVNFLQDARTSYRKAELDYVKFDVSGKNVSSYAYGGLYRSYSSYSTGKLADSTDKFYYEPSRTQYDLADVAYHTTRWAEAGKTVYIPFTVYGTKNEEASGTMAITIAQTMNFIDVKASDFFYEPVKWAVNNKITNGTSSTTFSPYKNCNRAEIVTFLWRAAGSPEPTSTRNPFTDVNSVRDASYYKAILWASQKGITAGTTATTFSPYQECTRSQIVTFLYRYAGKPSGYYSNPFKDVSSVNEASYYNAILWAVGKGITQGTSTTTFSPYASCTRGEAVTFLYRYVNGVK